MGLYEYGNKYFTGVISKCKYSYRSNTLVAKSHDHSRTSWSLKSRAVDMVGPTTTTRPLTWNPNVGLKHYKPYTHKPCQGSRRRRSSWKININSTELAGESEAAPTFLAANGSCSPEAKVTRYSLGFCHHTWFRV